MEFCGLRRTFYSSHISTEMKATFIAKQNVYGTCFPSTHVINVPVTKIHILQELHSSYVPHIPPVQHSLQLMTHTDLTVSLQLCVCVRVRACALSSKRAGSEKQYGSDKEVPLCIWYTHTHDIAGGDLVFLYWQMHCFFFYFGISGSGCVHLQENQQMPCPELWDAC